MRAVVARVAAASVTVGERVVGRIERGLLVLLGVAVGDEPADADRLAGKIAGLRIFPDERRPLNRDVGEAGGAVLVVSQFTLLADATRGRRPSLDRAAPPETSRPLYERFVGALRAAGLVVATGEFGASMQVASVNDGPVTLLLTTRSPDPL